MSRWTWLILCGLTQLRLARPIAEDHRQRWEHRRKPGALTPGRVRRDFGRLAALAGTRASPPKPSRAGPGRPKGRTSTPAPRHPVLKRAALRHVRVKTQTGGDRANCRSAVAETVLLSRVTFQTAVATKAARCVLAGGRPQEDAGEEPARIPPQPSPRTRLPPEKAAGASRAVGNNAAAAPPRLARAIWPSSRLASPRAAFFGGARAPPPRGSPAQTRNLIAQRAEIAHRHLSPAAPPCSPRRPRSAATPFPCPAAGQPGR